MNQTSQLLNYFLEEFVIYIDQYDQTPDEEMITTTLLGELYNLLDNVENLEKTRQNYQSYFDEIILYIQQLQKELSIELIQ